MSKKTISSTTIKLLAEYSIDISSEDIQEAKLSNKYSGYTILEITAELAKLKIIYDKVIPAWIDVKK